MRPLHLWALLVGVAAAGAACGGDSGNGPSNTAPTAAFTHSCTDLTCTFGDASSDPDAGDAVASWDWDFGDNSTHATVQNPPAHTYAQAGPYHVRLVVKDQAALSSAAADSLVTVTAPNPTGPTAGFTVTCNGLDCSFTDTSTPAGALTYQWDFGEPSSGANNTSTIQNPTHTYAATDVTPFTITLTVTDAQGATGTTNQTITVSPPATLKCDNGSGTFTACTMDLTQKAIVTVTVTSTKCEFVGNTFAITQPIQQTLFTDGCKVPAGTVYTLDGPNPDKSFNAPTSLQAQFTQGSGKPTDPPKGPPAIRVTGSFPDWSVAIDDGGNLGGSGEPNFTDIILAVHATVVQ
jgi:PKD repeat protein